MRAKKIIKICVTGGPSGGKTTLIEALQKDMGDKLSVVPEAASILYRGGFPRKGTEIAKKRAQRAIYYTQRELEDLAVDESNTAFVVCDRGSLDSVAYWPSSADNYFTSLSTQRSSEMARYDWVLHMDTAAHNGFDTTNPVRVESHLEALELNEKIKQAWQGHSQRIIIAHRDDFLLKLTIARKAIALIMAGNSLEEIQSQLKTVSI